MKNRFSAEKTAKALRKAWVRADDFSLFDVILFAAVALFCFVSFIHPDIMYTGNSSWIMSMGIVYGLYITIIPRRIKCFQPSSSPLHGWP